MPTAGPLHVPIDELLAAMTSSPSAPVTFYFDVHGGDVVMVLHGDDDENADAVEDDPERFRPVPRLDVEQELRWMEAFVRTLDEGDVRDELLAVFEGESGYGRCRGTVDRYPDIRDAWLQTRREQLLRVAHEWFETLGVEVTYDAHNTVEDRATNRGEPAPVVGLIDLIILGGPSPESESDTTETYHDRVVRRMTAPSQAEAEATFARVARDICRHHDVAWRNRFVEGKETFEHGRMRLHLKYTTIELSIQIPAEIRDAFYPPRSSLG